MANEPSTIALIPLREIHESVIVLKDGSLRAIVEISALNFELRSSDEQNAILQQFQAFLNAIDFQVQIVVHSRKFNLATYLTTVQTAAEQLASELMKVQAGEYLRFITQLSELSNIMSKRFYVILPFIASPTESETKKGFFSGFTSLFSSKKESLASLSPEQFAAAQTQLQQRADIIVSGLSGIGLRGHILPQNELFALFGDLYNPVVPASTTPITS